MSTQVVPFDDQPVANDERSQRPVPHQLAIIPTSAPVEFADADKVRPKSVEFDPRTDIMVWASGHGAVKPLRCSDCLLGIGLITMAAIDNMLAYLTFMTVRAFHGRLYNTVDLHFTLLPGIDMVLLCFAVLGTVVFFMMVVCVECLKLPLFHEMMNFRLFFSAMPCGIICSILLYYSERTQWAPFATVMAVLCTIFVWCLHMRTVYSSSLNVLSKISLDISWFVAILCAIVLGLFFATDKLYLLTSSDTLGCPYAANERMPVYVQPLERWYCAPWDSDKPMLISRTPVNSVPVSLTCSDTFIAAFGLSIEPHLIHCPVGCLRTFSPLQGSHVVGCGVYAVDSPVCVAAIHAGQLTDKGGQAIIYGRLGTSHFQRCSRNSITSVDRYITQSGSIVGVRPSAQSSGSSPFLANGGRRLAVTVPTVLDAQGRSVPQAFHFNNDQPGGLPQTREYVWLKKYEKTPSGHSGVEDGKPWTRIEATVSLRFAGIELFDEKINLGQGAPQSLFIKKKRGQVFDAKPTECSIGESGVVCTGAGAAVVQLDFCRKEVKQCLDK